MAYYIYILNIAIYDWQFNWGGSLLKSNEDVYKALIN